VAHSYDAVVVGGGFSGLYAAALLSSKGQRVCVLEAAPHLGGRAFSYRDPKTGDEVDNGQHALLGAYAATKRFLTLLGTLSQVRFQQRLSLPFRTPVATLHLETPNLPAPLHLLFGLLTFGGLSVGERLLAIRFGAALFFGRKPGASETLQEWLTRAGQLGAPSERLWTPLAIAALNESPERASAMLFAEVLRRAFLSKASDSVIGLSSVPLSELYVRPAESFLTSRDGAVRLRSRAVALVRRSGRVVDVKINDGNTLHAGAVVLAVPPPAAGKLLLSAGLSAPWVGTMVERGSPILSVHLWYDRPVIEDRAPITGLWGSLIQWVFDRGHLSLVVSDSRAFALKTRAEAVQIASSEIARFFPLARTAKLLSAAVRKEPSATFAGSPEAQAHRPGPKTPVANVVLAGDWTNTGLPGTIEGACLSAEAAVAALPPVG